MSTLLKTCRFLFLKDYPTRWPRLFMWFYPRSKRAGLIPTLTHNTMH